MQRIDRIEIQMALPDEVIRANIARNLDRHLPAITDCGDWRENMPIAIVGAGPSLRDEIGELRRFKHVMACGSVHDYLIENGIYPSWTVICDPDPIMALYLTMPWPHCKYLVGSLCDEAVFRILDGQDVYIWNLYNSESDKDFYDGRNVPLVGGGCTVGTRAMFLAMSFGYVNQHLFGFDNCIEPDLDETHFIHHAFGEYKDESETLGHIYTVKMQGSDKVYHMAGYMLAQLFDFKKTLTRFADTLRVTVHGDGAIAEIMRLGSLRR